MELTPDYNDRSSSSRIENDDDADDDDGDDDFNDAFSMVCVVVSAFLGPRFSVY